MNDISDEDIWTALRSVEDPEIPSVSIVGLGIVRRVERLGPEAVLIVISPTYSGCPALEVIEEEISKTLHEVGFATVHLVRSFSPPWTTEWIDAETRTKLSGLGIAPPGRVQADHLISLGPVPARKVQCPRCGSHETELTSEFGSTACKALRKCVKCSEPFEEFKPF